MKHRRRKLSPHRVGGNYQRPSLRQGREVQLYLCSCSSASVTYEELPTSCALRDPLYRAVFDTSVNQPLVARKHEPAHRSRAKNLGSRLAVPGLIDHSTQCFDTQEDTLQTSPDLKRTCLIRWRQGAAAPCKFIAADLGRGNSQIHVDSNNPPNMPSPQHKSFRPASVMRSLICTSSSAASPASHIAYMTSLTS